MDKNTHPTEATEIKTGEVEQLKDPKNIIEKAINKLRGNNTRSGS